MIKYLKFCIILAIAFTSIACKTKLPLHTNEVLKFDTQDLINSEIANNFDEDSIKSTIKIDTLALDSSKIDLEDSLIVIKKDIYKIAIILPFQEDTLRNAWNKAKGNAFSDFKTTEESELSASFIEGMLLALKELKLDAQFDIKVYDDKNSETKILDIIEDLKSNPVDIVIGPYSKKNVIKVAEYTALNKIIHLSPFSPSKSSSLGNKRFYMLEPSLEQHLKSMVDYSVDSLKNAKIIFVYHNNDISLSYVDLLSSYISDLNVTRDDKNKIIFEGVALTTNGGFSMSKYIDPLKKNVFIVNSFNENFLHGFLRQASGVNTNNTIIFGMPGWENSEILRLEYINDAKIHFTKSVWIDEEDPKTEKFRELYKTKYSIYPNEFAYLGYDLVAIFIPLINKEGLNFNHKLIGFTYNGLIRNYLFKEVVTKEKVVHRIENANLFIYKVEDYEQIILKK
jgi:ABC-type branched-subunit amino acid transport system substrate-binding protein